MSLRHDGSWDPPARITPRLAMVQWGCRVIVFQQIHLVLQEQESFSSEQMEQYVTTSTQACADPLISSEFYAKKHPYFMMDDFPPLVISSRSNTFSTILPSRKTVCPMSTGRTQAKHGWLSMGQRYGSIVFEMGFRRSTKIATVSLLKTFSTISRLTSSLSMGQSSEMIFRKERLVIACSKMIGTHSRQTSGHGSELFLSQTGFKVSDHMSKPLTVSPIHQWGGP